MGALVVCPACEHHPADDGDRARHLVAADADDAATLARRIGAGQPACLDDAAVRRAEEDLAAATPVKVAMFGLLILAVPVVGMLALLVVAALLLSAS